MKPQSILLFALVLPPLACVGPEPADSGAGSTVSHVLPDGTYDTDWIYDEANDTGEFTVHPGLTYPEDHPCFDGVQFEADRVQLDFEFSCDASDLEWMPGKFVVGVEDGGYLRKIEKVSHANGSWSLLTSEAALEDVVANTTVNFRWAPEETARDIHVAIPMPKLKWFGGKLKLASGEFGFDGSMNYTVRFGWFRIQESTLDLNFEPYAEAQFTVDVVSGWSASPSHTFTPDWNIANPTFAIGPVPVVVNISLRRQLVTDFSLPGTVSTTIDTSVRMPMVANAHYERGRSPDWDGARSATLNATANISEVTIETQAKAEVGYKLTLMALFYGVAGPAFSATPRLTGTIEPKCDSINAEVKPGVDFGLSLQTRIEDRGNTEADAGDNADNTYSVNWDLGSIESGDPIWQEEWQYPYGFALPGCGQEECGNGVDDDGDKLIDCEDEDDCAARDQCTMRCGTGDTISCGETVFRSAEAFGSAPDLFDHYACNVGAYHGSEFVFEWTAPSSRTVELAFIDPEPSVADLDIMVLDAGRGCQGSSCLERYFNSGEFEAEGGKTYYIVVDGFSGDVGDFELQLSCP